MNKYQPEYEKSHALLIGIDSYKEFRPLETAIKGVDALAELLTDNLEFEQVITLTDGQATQSKILEVINDPLSNPKKVGPDDRVIIYFAGHGVTFPTAEGDIGCILPVDAKPGNIYTMIEMDRLTRLANRIYAKHVLFLLDSCFSGFATTREAEVGVERQLDDFLSNPVRQVITAGTNKQTASDMWGPEGHSLFTGFLLKGLRGAVPAPSGIMRAFNLAAYLQAEVATHSKSLQTPQYAALLGTGEGGDFVFGVHRRVALPQWILAAADSDDATQRLVGVSQLRGLAEDQDQPELAAQALEKLQMMAESDSDSMVYSSARAVVGKLLPETEIAEVEREEIVVIEPPEPAREPIVEEEIAPQRVEPVYQAPPRPEREQSSGSSKGLLSPLLLGVGGVLIVGIIIGVMAIAGVFKSKTDPISPTPTDEPEVESTNTAQPEPTETEAVIVPPEEPDNPTPTTEPKKTPTLTAGEAARQFAETGVSSNNEWTPYTEVVNGVEMALVPVGCFMMGSEDGGSDESPVHEVCFEDPFWIDVTEVTNGAYGSSGYFDLGDNYPRDLITWIDSDAHCKERNARLPTEAEWEYAARGSSNLIYPWGNEFVGDNAVSSSNSSRGAEVGSRPGGISWIGVYDLSGNVWEWVNDWYDVNYYGTLEQGAINPQGSPNRTNVRVLRGGSWDWPFYNLRTAERGWFAPDGSFSDYGFRCARSYDK